MHGHDNMFQGEAHWRDLPAYIPPRNLPDHSHMRENYIFIINFFEDKSVVNIFLISFSGTNLITTPFKGRREYLFTCVQRIMR